MRERERRRRKKKNEKERERMKERKRELVHEPRFSLIWFFSLDLLIRVFYLNQEREKGIEREKEIGRREGEKEETKEKLNYV